MTALSPRALYRLHHATARYFDTAVPALKPLLSLGLLPQSPLPPTDRAALAAFLSGASAPPPAALQPPPTATHAVYSAPRSLAPFVAATARARGEGAGAGGAPAPSPAAAQSELARLADLGALFASSAAGARAAAALAPHTAAAAHLAAAPLAEADAVRPGTLLLEHPSLLLPGRGVLLIYDIAQGITEVEGHTRWTLRALALNRPLHATVSAALPHLAGALGALGALPLFYGGPDGPGELCIVHRLGDLPGAVPLDGLAPPPALEAVGGGGGGGAAAGEGFSAARSGLYLGGELEAFEQALAQGRAQPRDFRVTVGRTEMQLEEEAGGALRLPHPYGGDAQLCAAGPGVAAHALCPVLVQEEEEEGGRGRGRAPAPLGYDFSRFWHQNVAWSAAVAGVAAWVEVGEAARGREMKQWASPLCHAAVAHYFAGGMGREEFLQLEEALRQGRA